MTRREQLKVEIDTVNEAYLETLHRILIALKNDVPENYEKKFNSGKNPLKGSILFEKDILSPIEESWDIDL